MAAMFAAAPAFMLIIAELLPLEQPVRAALLALAVSPMPPIISKKEISVGDDANYAIGLQVLETVLSIAVVPAVMAVVGGGTLVVIVPVIVCAGGRSLARRPRCG